MRGRQVPWPDISELMEIGTAGEQKSISLIIPTTPTCRINCIDLLGEIVFSHLSGIQSGIREIVTFYAELSRAVRKLKPNKRLL